jgi:colicin import membrane protein
MRLRHVIALAVLAAAGAARAQGADLNVITSVDLMDAGRSLVIEVQGSKPPNFTTFSMADPPRFVIDLSEARFHGVPEDLPARDPLIVLVKNLSYGSGATSIARIVVAFSADVDPPDVQTAANSLVVRVERPGGRGMAVAQQDQTRREREQAEERALVEAERRAEAQARAEAAAAAARRESEAQAQAEAERRAQELAAADAARREAEALARTEAARRPQQDEPLRAEADASAAALAGRAAAEEARREEARRAREEYERERQEAVAAASAEAERKSREAQQRQEAERVAREEARLAREEERDRKAEDARLAREAEAQRREAERLARHAAREEGRRARDLEAHLAADVPSAQLREIGFRQMPGVSRVFVRTSVTPQFTISDVGDDTVRVELQNTRVQRRNDTRLLDTSFFPSAVAAIAPAKMGSSYVVDIKLKQRVPYRQRIEGDMLAIDFERPGAEAAAEPELGPGPEADGDQN